MAPNREKLTGSYPESDRNNALNKPLRLSMENLQRTISDISFELSKELLPSSSDDHQAKLLPPISEVVEEEAKCECCGMSEECTPRYIKQVRDNFCGKLVCGLCAEAVDREMEKNGGKKEEALNEHMNQCVKFNRFGRAYPVLCQAEVMREMLKKSASNIRAKSKSPRDRGGQSKASTRISRSSSCIASITKEISDGRMAN